MSNLSWVKRKERGSLVLIRLIAWLAINLGRPVGLALLYPISLYFVLFMPYARRSSRHFLTRSLGRPPRFSEVFRHFFTFALTILDRVFLVSGNYDDFDIRIEGLDIVQREYRNNRGCILMGSHLGSFDLLRCLGEDNPDIRFKALMHGVHSEKVGSVLGLLNPGLADSIIAVGDSGSMLKVQEALAAGELVGILADRQMSENRTARCKFYGEALEFPATPVLLAGLINTPVVMFFAVCTGNKSYRIHFELLSPEVNFNRQNRQQIVEQLTQQYVSRLEYHSRRYPFNWFNFYDYWQEFQPASR